MPLVFIATPLGNLGDITLRSLDALREAELIVAEDTRVTRNLLNALKIGAKEIWSYREQNAAAVTNGILERARDQVVAVVSDAGMPGISDPGSELVAAARAGAIHVDVLPGPSAVLGVAVLSGFPLRRFIFEGFPPRSSGARRNAFRAALAQGATTIWYESPQRIRATLKDLGEVAADSAVFLVREYTKKFEQQVVGTPGEVDGALSDPIRGEISFAIAPYAGTAEERSPGDLDGAIDELLTAGRTVREIAKALAERGFGERRELYNQASTRKRARGMGAGSAAEHEESR